VTDCLSLANALADAKIDRPAAERIATEIFEAIHDSVATKSDVQAVRTDLRAEMAALRAEFTANIAALRAEFKADIAVLRAEFKADIAALRAELKAEIALLEHRLLIWLGGLMVVLFGLLFAALRYLPPAH
jgi:hypothetical protein